MDISVVLATRNRALQLSETLEHYRKLNTENIRWELLVTDNGSTDDTLNVLKSVASDLPLSVFECPDPGKAAAVNLALEHASGALIVFTDDDILPDENWLLEYATGLTHWPNEAIFGGQIEPRFEPGTSAWIASPNFPLARVAYSHYKPADSEQKVSTAPFGGNFAVKRTVLMDARFDAEIGPRPGSYRMGVETELLTRLAKNGWNFVYLDRAFVQHVIRPEQTTERWLLKRAYNAGLSRGRNQRSSGKGPPMSATSLAYESIRLGLKYQVQRMFADEQSRLRTGVRWQQARGELQGRKDMSHPGE